MGKGSLIYVIGLGVIICYQMMNINSIASDSAGSMIDHRTRAMLHDASVAGANLGTHRVLMFGDSATVFRGALQGVPFTVTIDSIIPSGNREVTSVASLTVETPLGTATLHDTVIATLRHVQFAKFAYFSGAEQNGYMTPTSNSTSGVNMWKVTGDSLFGYAHTNGRWNLGGRPYFQSKVTAFNPPNTMVYGGIYDPAFEGGTQWGISVNRPLANLTRLEAIASGSGSIVHGEDVGLNFFSDGNVEVKIPATTGTMRHDTISQASLAPAGVFAVKDADLRVQGTYRGKITLAAFTGTAAGNTKGNIWIDGDIRASTSPRNNPSSLDMLGLVSERMTYLTTTNPVDGTLFPRNSSSVVTIEAAIYAHNGVFGVEDYMNVPVSGRISLFGSLTMAASTSTGRTSGGSIVAGYLKSIAHDPRYLTDAPPSFPVSTNFELIAWWEQ